MNREGTLNADAEGNLTHGEGLADAVALTADADTLEELGTLGAALDDLDVDVKGIARAEGRDIVAQRSCINLINEVCHWCFPFQFKTEDPGATARRLTGSCLLHRTSLSFHTPPPQNKLPQTPDTCPPGALRWVTH